eukprot:scaffold3290_cov77-Skeletonema_dohrnii-CCMP3373.AAC.5
MKDSSDLIDIEDLYEEAANFFIAGSYTSNDPTSSSTAARARAGPFVVVLTAAAVSLLVVW